MATKPEEVSVAQPEEVSVAHIFENIHYVIPIYQRNYAWQKEQIEQLIDDILSADIGDDNKYFLGNLIVNQTDSNVFEVIDGQQRLTTLYLLERQLGFSFNKDALRFEAREKSNRTLSCISDKKDIDGVEELYSPEIKTGMDIIHDYFRDKIDCEKSEIFKNKLNNVMLVRVQVPQNIDMNHYFEIMNTRGEQLELHEIAKAKLLEKLNDKYEKYLASLIWESCSDMNSYVQMNFDINIRRKIFTDDWSSLKEGIKNFDSLIGLLKNDMSHKDDKSIPVDDSEERKSLLDILKKNEKANYTDEKSDAENERFESTVSFPNFLLQVNSAVKKNVELDNDDSLDDKKLLAQLNSWWETTESAKSFLFNLLRCRVLFDKYVLKREYARDYKNTGKWSLQKLEKYHDNEKRNDKPKYVGSFSNEEYNKKLRTLQSCLRITYTSPKNMHWITVVLKETIVNENPDILTLLEHYCSKKVKDSDYEKVNGFKFERIIFSYLDYLIYRDGYSYEGQEIIKGLSDDWQFQFRNSIEHFYPQNPIESSKWDDKDLNAFGNLALITVSGNSKFSNLLPASKIDSHPSIIEQSLKLIIMAQLTTNTDKKWTQELSKKHGEDMFEILKRNIMEGDL